MDLSQSKRRMEDQDRTCHSCAFNTWWKSQMIANVLAATLASYVWGFKTEDILVCLSNQRCSNTGRMNILNLKFKVLIDFAHNASGYKGIEEYLQSVDATKDWNYCWYW
jgi:folylpolyglutamate synthase/dihydropteroate synthase